MITLLSPAKLINMDGQSWSTQTAPEFHKKANALAGKLKGLSVKKMMELMHLSKELGALNVERYKNWDVNEVPAGGKSAALAFNGEVYRGLDAISMTDEQVAYAQDHLVILSGLYGMLRPADVIQAYRLEMGCGFSYRTYKNLYAYWKGDLGKALNNRTDAVLNCASNEYAKAVDRKQFKGRWVDVVFKEKKGDDYKVVMVFAKQARGRMARFVMDHQIDKLDDVRAFDQDGYLFNAAASSDDQFVFTRG